MLEASFRPSVVEFHSVQPKLLLKSIDRRLEKVEGTQDALIKDVSDLKGAKSLIIPVVVAVLTSILTLLVRSIPNP